jgi:Uma2 family endonuclease
MATTVARSERLLTAREYARLADPDQLTELIRGRLVILPPPYPFHGFVCGRVMLLIGGFIALHKVGYPIGNDSGVITERGPDTVRGADFCFYAYKRIPKGALKKKADADVAPNLIVEVRSADDSWKKVLKKVGEYLEAGVDVVCVLDVVSETARVYTGDEPETLFERNDSLSLPTVLPGFSAKVREFFE